MAEFKIPEFLQNQSVDDIHLRMMDNLPDDIDTSEGSHVWNLTYPPAYEKAFMAEYLILEAIKTIFPQFCENYPEIMDYHAETKGMKRKDAECATGEITITGQSGVEIPAGTNFSTISVNGQPSIDFHTTKDAVIDDTGTVTAPIQANVPGKSGNVAKNTIVLNSNSIDGIESAINGAPTLGGIEEETTEALQLRIVESDRTMEESYVGTPSDYKRWALSVQGTGSAVVVRPTDDTTPIIIVLTDANGNPADEELCTAVYNYIMSPDDPDARLANINDQIEVRAPETMTLTVRATIELLEGYTTREIADDFITAMQSYIKEAVNTGEIKYSKVYSILSSIEGVNDHRGLTINGGTLNVTLDSSKVPRVTADSVIFASGTV